MIHHIAITLLCLSSLILAQGCRSVNSNLGGNDSEPDSRNTVNLSYDNITPDFNALNASTGFDVEYTVGPRAKVDIICSEKLADRLVVEVKNGCLNLGLKKTNGISINNKAKIKATVTGPALTEITTSSAASVAVMNNMSVTGSPLTLTASSGSSIEFEVPVSYASLAVTTSSGADVEINGITVPGSVSVSSSSGAGIEIEGLQAASVEATVSSGADIELSGKAYTIVYSASSGGSLKAGNLVAASGSATASSGGSISSDVKSLSKSSSSGGSVRNRQ